MPFVSTRAQLSLTGDRLRQLSQSRTESVARVQRAQILLRYAQGETVSKIAAGLDTTRPKVERCTSKALQLEVGRPCRICQVKGGGRWTHVAAGLTFFRAQSSRQRRSDRASVKIAIQPP